PLRRCFHLFTHLYLPGNLGRQRNRGSISKIRGIAQQANLVWHVGVCRPWRCLVSNAASCVVSSSLLLPALTSLGWPGCSFPRGESCHCVSSSGQLFELNQLHAETV